MDGSLTAAFWGVSMLFVLTPGVDWAYAIASGLRPGGALPGVLGMLTGHLAATVAVAAGVAAVMATSEITMSVLTTAGALYLLWLGASALRHSGTATTPDQAVPGGKLSLFTKGLGVSLLNPKVFLLFLALLPQFSTPQAAWPLGSQMLVLGIVHVLNCALVYLAVGYGSTRVLTTRPRAARRVSLLSGIVMLALGATLITETAITSLS